MIQNVQKNIQGAAAPYMVIVTADIIQPMSNFTLKAGYPKVSISPAGAVTFGSNPQPMAKGAGNSYSAMFQTNTNAGITVQVAANWCFAAETGEEVANG